MRKTKAFLIACGMTCGLYACSGTADDGSEETAEQPSGNGSTVEAAELGEATYKAQCQLCHGEDGKLGASGAKDLQLSTLSHQDAVMIVSYGRGGMMAYNGLLTKEQIENVVSYIETLRKK